MIRILALVLVLFSASNVQAVNYDDHEYSSIAQQHCELHASQAASWKDAQDQSNTWVANPCELLSPGQSSQRWKCHIRQSQWAPTGGQTCGYASNDQWVDYHNFESDDPSCPDPGTPWPYPVHYDHGPAICNGPCEMQPGAGVNVCLGGACYGPVQFTGSPCPEGGEEPSDAPAGCTMDGGVLTCDCNANPTAWFCDAGPTDIPSNCVVNSGVVTCSGDNDQDGDGEDDGDGGTDPPPGGPGEGDDGGGTGTGDGDCDPFHDPSCGWSGSAGASQLCDELPTCDGNPEMCAILRQNWYAQCYPFLDTGAEEQELPELTGEEFDEFNTSIDLNGEGGLDDSGFLGGGVCPISPTVDVLGTTFEFDMSAFCSIAAILGNFVMFAAYMVAGRILFAS